MNKKNQTNNENNNINLEDEHLIEKNYILAELYIGDEDINKNIRIIPYFS